MTAQAYFQNIQSVIEQHLKNANKRIYVSMAWLTDKVLFNCLCEQARKEIEVAVIIYDDDINDKLFLSRLENYGGRVYKVARNLMHNKFCVIDDRVLITGSYNWTFSAAKEDRTGEREENIVVIEGNETLVKDYTEQFKLIIRKYFGETYHQDVKAFDLAKVLKRLDVIKQLLELEDYEDIVKHSSKIEVYPLPDPVMQILNHIRTKQYETAIHVIQKYRQKAVTITAYVNPEVERLKSTIKVLEIEIGAIANEIEEAEKLIHDFGIRHNRELGDLVRKILLLRKEKLKQEADQLKDKADETYKRKQRTYKEAEQDYEDFSKSYEATRKKKFQELNNSEQKELKKLYRKAAMICHPDKVSESMKGKAEKIFDQLQKAYEENDLESVRKMSHQMEQGVAFVSDMEEILDDSSIKVDVLEEKLNALYQRLHQRKNELLQQLQQIHHHETYRQISTIQDWGSYFATTKEQLHKELDLLTQTLSIAHEEGE